MRLLKWVAGINAIKLDKRLHRLQRIIKLSSKTDLPGSHKKPFKVLV